MPPSYNVRKADVRVSNIVVRSVSQRLCTVGLLNLPKRLQRVQWAQGRRLEMNRGSRESPILMTNLTTVTVH